MGVKVLGAQPFSALQGPITYDRLFHAIKTMDKAELERLLHGGLDVNEPLDKYGHTIMDLFAKEHAHMIRECMEFRARPQELTSNFYSSQESALEILELLGKEGALFSS